MVGQSPLQFKKGELLNKALVIATNAHAGQFDKGGNPYILHPLAILHMLIADGADEEQQCIGVLHDVVEDCGITYVGLKGDGMTDRIIDGVRCMTKIPGESYDEYKEKIKSNSDTIKVKIKDLKHNTDIQRLKGVTAKDMARMERYFHLYMELINLEKQQNGKV
jgi:(p)ppGpp synthase/HD superfamily hydrolase